MTVRTTRPRLGVVRPLDGLLRVGDRDRSDQLPVEEPAPGFGSTSGRRWPSACSFFRSPSLARSSRAGARTTGWAGCSRGQVVDLVPEPRGLLRVPRPHRTPARSPGAVWLASIQDALWVPFIFVTTVFLFLLFPEGRLVGTGRKIAGGAALVAVVIASVGSASWNPRLLLPGHPEPVRHRDLRDRLRPDDTPASSCSSWCSGTPRSTSSDDSGARSERNVCSSAGSATPRRWCCSSSFRRSSSKRRPALAAAGRIRPLLAAVRGRDRILKYRLYDIDVVEEDRRTRSSPG